MVGKTGMYLKSFWVGSSSEVRNHPEKKTSFSAFYICNYLKDIMVIQDY